MQKSKKNGKVIGRVGFKMSKAEKGKKDISQKIYTAPKIEIILFKAGKSENPEKAGRKYRSTEASRNMERSKRREKIERLRDRLEAEQIQLLFYIEETADVIDRMSAGEIYSAYGAEVVKRLDALTAAEERVSEAIEILSESAKAEKRVSGAN